MTKQGREPGDHGIIDYVAQMVKVGYQQPLYFIIIFVTAIKSSIMPRQSEFLTLSIGRSYARLVKCFLSLKNIYLSCDHDWDHMWRPCFAALILLFVWIIFPCLLVLMMLLIRTYNYHMDSHLLVNSSPVSAAYMRQWTGSSLIQMVACCLFGTEPLAEPILTYCQLDS